MFTCDTFLLGNANNSFGQVIFYKKDSLNVFTPSWFYYFDVVK